MKLYQRILGIFTLAYQLLRVSLQTIYGGWRISKLTPPIVTIFGGAKLKEHDQYFKQAYNLGKLLMEHDISVLTGGGPGIMEAVSCGVLHKSSGKISSIGIGVRGLGQGRNPCVEEYFELNYFFARKLLLTRYSYAFVIFPGGFGTLDEFSEVLTLMQTKKMQQTPIVLIGKDYWSKFLGWVKGEALQHKLIDADNVKLFTLTDSLHEAFTVIQSSCKKS